MSPSFKSKLLNMLNGVFKFKLFEKMLLPFVKNKYLKTRWEAITPPHYKYKNPTYRIAKKNSLRLLGNLYDYNDWRVYWGFKEIERERLYRLAANAKTVIDVGTNNGWVLINIATIIKRNNGFIYGFEPHTSTYKRCIANIEKSKIDNCKVFNAGCGSVKGELLLAVVDETNSGQNRIISINEKTLNKSVSKIEVIRLDEQLNQLNNLDLIKIDVEGFELNVLKGADGLLKKFRPVIFIEIDDALLRANNTCPQEVLQFLSTNYNYTIKNATDMKLIDKNDTLTNCHIDVICHPA